MNDTPSIITEYITQAGAAMAKQFDDVLGALIEAHIGNKLDLANLRGRLTAETFAGDPEKRTMYCIDGWPLATFWPIESDFDGRCIRVTQRYQVHK